MDYCEGPERSGVLQEGISLNFLHETASEYEMSEKTDMTYETGHGIAEISEKD